MNRPALTLSVEELNEYVRRTLAGDPMLHSLRLRGEISNFKRHVSGHWYFTLKDSQSAINCAMFRNAAIGVAFRPADGQQVVLTGSVGLYPKTGSYQFYAEAMEQDGVGALYQRMEALKNRLRQEGLFDAALKKPLPLLPRGIGIVTSSTGAVIHDITRISQRRYPGIPLYLYAVAVQGEGAAVQIAKALAALDGMPEIDVLIIGRGGGSLEDLWAFNEETVARAIAACRKPVVSAVGHETDFTLADFVADVRAPTPSAAAELVVPEREALLATVEKLTRRLRRAGDACLVGKATALASARERIAAQTPEAMLYTLTERAKARWDTLVYRYGNALSAKDHHLRELTLRLRAASPQATLSRGFAMVLQSGRPVQSVALLNRENPFTVAFQDGSIAAQALRAGQEETP